MHSSDSGNAHPQGEDDLLLAPLADVHRPVSVATLPEAGLLFWIDNTRGAIYRANRKGGDRRAVVTHLHSPTRLAVDWVSMNIYWTDNLLDVIEIADVEGEHRFVVVSGKMDRPHAIELDAAAGMLFWTDVGQAGQDSQNCKNLMNDFLNCYLPSYKTKILPKK
jgi:hypothetical protein